MQKSICSMLLFVYEMREYKYKCLLFNIKERIIKNLKNMVTSGGEREQDRSLTSVRRVLFIVLTLEPYNVLHN